MIGTNQKNSRQALSASYETLEALSTVILGACTGGFTLAARALSRSCRGVGII